MDIEELTKSQIVLLTLLVSFVTSIATGIVTVSLLDQAPPEVTQSVSRIIRETVENAVPTAITQSAAVVGIKSDPQPTPPPPPPPDLAQIIGSAQRSVVRLYGGSLDAPIFLGLGLVIDTKGTVVTDYDAIGELEAATAEPSVGSSTPMSVVTRDSGNGLIYLSPTSTSSEAHFIPATLGTGGQAVGDTVIALSGKSDLRIASGLIVGSDGATPILLTNVPGSSIIKGTPIMNTKGEFLGLSTGTSRAVDPAGFMPIAAPAPAPKAGSAP